MIKMYHKIRTNAIAQWIIIGIRFLLGLSFMPSGMVKVLGGRFTTLSVDTPIGYFFESMYQTGLYWQYLGICQVLAAFLLFTQRFALLGALMFFAIVSNIFIITISLPFSGTWVVTLLMLCASILLLLWDWYRIRPILCNTASNKTIPYYNVPSITWQFIGLIVFILLLIYVTRNTL